MRIGIFVTTNIYYFKSALTYFRLLKYFLSIQGCSPEEPKMPTNTPLQDDLSFLRTLAERGLDTPLMAGPYLIAGGSWFAAASLIQV